MCTVFLPHLCPSPLHSAGMSDKLDEAIPMRMSIHGLARLTAKQEGLMTDRSLVSD